MVMINGAVLEYDSDGQYMIVDRIWDEDDKLDIQWEMGVKLVRSSEQVEENLDKLALQRGPLIYCIEEADNPDVDFENIRIDTNKPIDYNFRTDLLGGIGTLELSGIQNGEETYLTAIPYYAWSNRGDGWMKVWIEQGMVAHPDGNP